MPLEGGIYPRGTPIAELTARLGSYAIASADNDANAQALLALMTGDERLSVNKALQRLGLSWGWLHAYRQSNVEWWAKYRDIRDTLAEAYVDDASEMLDQGIEDIKASEPKIASALAQLWKEKATTRKWMSERTSTRWRASAASDGSGSQVQVVVVLPALAPLAPSATLAASGSELDYIDHTVDDMPQLPSSASETTG